jgi:myo-inositol-1(or 4)-monophosphatase
VPADVLPPPDLESLAVELAEGAADLVARRRGELAGGQHPGVSSKSTATDLVTDVDRAAERWLVDQLRARRPDDAVLGE